MAKHFFPNALVGFCLVSLLSLLACGRSEDSDFAQVLASRTSGERIDNLTPGALCSVNDPDFDGLRYPEQIAHCRREVSTEKKIAIAASYGIYGSERQDYEIDHLIPLNIGGSNNARNLWPLFRPLAREKSRFEQWLMNEVAEGHILQADAIDRIYAWRPGQRFP